MKQSGLILLALLIGSVGMAQEVTVMDHTTQQPLGNVSIFVKDGNFATVTGENGRADIAELRDEEAIHFQRLGYELKVRSYEQLLSADFKVMLKGTSISLQEMVISANRWEQNTNEIPNLITSIDAGEIAFKNPQTAADLLGETDQVYIQKSQLGGGSPMVRGFATNRVLLVVDGVRMNNAIFRSGNLQNVISLDANSISQSEVVFGPGSVIYGSDAIGGVLDFHTLNANLAEGDQTRVDANAMMRFSSANEEKTGHLDLNVGWKKWALRTSISYSDYDHQLMGKHGPDEYLRTRFVTNIRQADVVEPNPNPRIQVPTGFNQFNLLQKVRYQPKDSLQFEYGFHYSTTSNIPRYDRLIIESNNKLKSAEWYYGPQQWQMHNLTVDLKKNTQLYDRAKLVTAYQFYEESRHDRNFGSSFIRNRVENVDAFNANLDFDKSIGENHTLFYGAEAVINQVGSEAHRENVYNEVTMPTSTRYPDGSQWSSYAAYLTSKRNLSDQWTVLGGMRYSHIFINAPFDTTFFDFPLTRTKTNTGSVNGSAGVVYRPTDKWQLNLNLSTGFRAPNIDDIGKVFDSEPGSVVVPNPNLKPEYAYNAELGFEKTFADVARWSVTGYYTILDNAMLRRVHTFNGQDSIMYDGIMSQVQTLKNVGIAQVYGVQSSLEVNLLSGLMWRSSISWQEGFETSEATDEQIPLRHAAPTFGSSHLIYKMERLKLDVYGKFNGEIAHENLAPSEKGKPHLYAQNENGNPYSPAWWTLNVKAGFYLNKYFSVTAGVENILNKRYRPYSSGIAAPARNFIISVRGSF